MLPFPSLFLSFHNASSADPFLVFGIHLLLNPFTVTSGEMFCHDVMLHWQRRVTQGFWILPPGVKVWSFPKIHSLYNCNCLRWSLSGLFTTPSNTSSSEVFLLGMTKTFVFVELPVIVSFIASVKSLYIYIYIYIYIYRNTLWPFVSATSLLTIQPLVWHLTVISVGDCNSEYSVWCNLLPCTDAANLKVPYFYHRFCSEISSVIWWLIEVCWGFINISVWPRM